MNDITQGQSLFDKINAFLNELDLDFEVLFGLYLSSRREEHDREILTNYYRIHSGHSFDYFDDNGFVKKETTVRITGLLGVDYNAHFQLLELTKKLVTNAKTGHDHFGVQGNRLFR